MTTIPERISKKLRRQEEAELAREDAAERDAIAAEDAADEAEFLKQFMAAEAEAAALVKEADAASVAMRAKVDKALAAQGKVRGLVTAHDGRRGRRQRRLRELAPPEIEILASACGAQDEGLRYGHIDARPGSNRGAEASEFRRVARYLREQVTLMDTKAGAAALADCRAELAQLLQGRLPSQYDRELRQILEQGAP